MGRICWTMAEFLASALEPPEREAVLGDLAECRVSASAVGDLLGLVARRQLALWRDWHPWAILFGLVLPMAAMLSFGSAARSGSVTLWLYLNNWDWNLIWLPSFQHIFFLRFVVDLGSAYLMLACSSWICGFILGATARRATPAMSVLLCLAVTLGHFALLPLFVNSWFERVKPYAPNGPVIALYFYRVTLPVLVHVTLVLLPALLAVRHGASMRLFRWPVRALFSTAVGLSIFVLVLQTLFPYRALWHLFAPAMVLEGTPHAFGLYPLVFWPVLFWIVSAVRRRRRVIAACSVNSNIC